MLLRTEKRASTFRPTYRQRIANVSGGVMGMGALSFGARRRLTRSFVATISAVIVLLTLAQPATALSAKKLGFGVQPAGTTAGLILAPVTVEVLDQQNRLVTDSTAAVTVALTTSAGTLYGTKTVNAVGGIATFDTLRVLPAGTYALRATSPDLDSATSSSFTITGVGAVCGASGCPTLNDPNGVTPTNQNKTTGTVQISSCPGAETESDFASYDESAAAFCDGGCLGSAVFFSSDCDSGDPWLIIYRLDKSILRTDRGAVHVVMYIEYEDGSVDPIPDCIKQGILDPGPVCVSRQYKNGQGDSITEILKTPGDPRIAG